MKNILIVSLLLVLSACNSKDDTTNDPDPNVEILTVLPDGIWKVTYFFYNASDETDTYSSFTFNFDANGTVLAGNDILSDSGTWAYEDASNDANDDDGIENDEELILTFEETSLFVDLSDNWHITMVSATKVELFDESGDGSMQFLTFTKQ